MASVLVRASRGAARAAATAAASSRVGSGGGAGAASYLRLLLRGSPAAVASPPPFGRAGLSSHSNWDGCCYDESDDCDCRDVIAELGNCDGEELGCRRRRVPFLADDKDLESDEAMWALYERWCKVWGEKRDRDEMLRRFDRFKECASRVDRFNKEAIRDGRCVRLEMNMFADGKLRELSCNKIPTSWGNPLRRTRLSASGWRNPLLSEIVGLPAGSR